MIILWIIYNFCKIQIFLTNSTTYILYTYAFLTCLTSRAYSPSVFWECLSVEHNERTQSLPNTEGFYFFTFLFMSTFGKSPDADSNRPAPSLRDYFTIFSNAGGRPEDFLVLVSQNARSLTVAVAKKVGNTLSFPTQMISLRAGSSESNEVQHLIHKINSTAQILGTPSFKYM